MAQVVVGGTGRNDEKEDEEKRALHCPVQKGYFATNYIEKYKKR